MLRAPVTAPGRGRAAGVRWASCRAGRGRCRAPATTAARRAVSTHNSRGSGLTRLAAAGRLRMRAARASCARRKLTSSPEALNCDDDDRRSPAHTQDPSVRLAPQRVVSLGERAHAHAASRRVADGRCRAPPVTFGSRRDRPTCLSRTWGGLRFTRSLILTSELAAFVRRAGARPVRGRHNIGWCRWPAIDGGRSAAALLERPQHNQTLALQTALRSRVGRAILRIATGGYRNDYEDPEVGK